MGPDLVIEQATSKAVSASRAKETCPACEAVKAAGWPLCEDCWSKVIVADPELAQKVLALPVGEDPYCVAIAAAVKLAGGTRFILPIEARVQAHVIDLAQLQNNPDICVRLLKQSLCAGCGRRRKGDDRALCEICLNIIAENAAALARRRPESSQRLAHRAKVLRELDADHLAADLVQWTKRFAGAIHSLKSRVFYLMREK